MSIAEENRINKIIFHVQQHPLCSFLEILNSGQITKNRDDLMHDLDFLINFGCIQKISFISRFYVSQIAKEWEHQVKFFKNMDEMIHGIRKNTRIKHTRLGAEIKIKISNGKITSTKLIDICSEPNCADKFDYIFSQLVGNFLQKCKIIEIQSRKGHFFIDRKILDDLDELANFIRMFLENQEYFEQNVYSDSVLTKKLISNIEQRYDLDKNYIDTFRSSRRYTLKKRIEIWLEYLFSDDIYHVRKKYGFPSNKAVKNALKPIQDLQGKPDMEKIIKLNKIEKDRCIQSISIQDVVLLTVRYDIRDVLNRCVPQSKEHKELTCMIKKELPNLLAI